MIRWERQQDGNWLGLSGELLVATVAKDAVRKGTVALDHHCVEASQGLAQGSWTPILLDRCSPSCRGILGEVARGGGAPPGRDATGITERCQGARAQVPTAQERREGSRLMTEAHWRQPSARQTRCADCTSIRYAVGVVSTGEPSREPPSERTSTPNTRLPYNARADF